MVLTNRNWIIRPHTVGKTAIDVDAQKSFVAVGGASSSPHVKGVRLDPGRSPYLTVTHGLVCQRWQAMGVEKSAAAILGRRAEGPNH